MTALVYRCPHCGATHEIDESLVGDRVDCRKCGRKFEAAAPVAQPVQADDGQTPAYHVVAGEGEIEEKLIEVHPSPARKHPFRTLGLIVVAVLGLAGVVAGLTRAGIGLPVSGSVLAIAGAVVAGLAGLCELHWWVRSRFTTLTVTSSRSTLRYGLFARETTEVRHRDVRNLQVNQNWIERLFGVGDLAISSAGQEGLEIVIRGIPNPEKVAAIVRDMQD